MKVRPAYILILLLLLGSAWELYQTALPLTAERTAAVMGTTVRIKIKGAGAPHWTSRAIWEMQRLDRSFNRFDPRSEVSLLNRLGSKARLQLSPDLTAVLKIAEEVRLASAGAFNIRFNNSALDLGGIGKGYAVEAARRLLLKKGVKSAIIDLHSSIAVIGDGWRVGIRDPRIDKDGREKQGVAGIVILNDGDALATSGQYEQPGHIVDPRTGRPADRCLSVTVVAKDAALADALSTAVFVLGPVDGRKLLARFGARSFIIGRNGKIYDNLSVKLR
ncbi:MAG: FAD:protein FMN transferase [Candidatus Margulisbacteria bacterium]|jgi:thiamine biosynthesis lipoprotein|nr:FAD:protein FMN transferase [Candidatus Margulisiibacteriota bacterium]